MVISNKKRFFVCITLIILFLLISVLMVSSINLFSLSKKDVNLEHIDILEKIDTDSIKKILSPSDKLNLINYYIEYQNLKSNIKNLSKKELNRLLYLASTLSEHFDKKELDISEDMVDEALERYDSLSNTVGNSKYDEKELKDILSEMKENKKILNNLDDMKKEVRKLYSNNKISKDSYEKILKGISNIEYKVNVSALDKKDLQVDLNSISSVLDAEKSSFSADVDVSSFSNIDGILENIQGELDGINYITDFVKQGTALDGTQIELTDIESYSKIFNIANQLDMSSFSDVLKISQNGGIGAISNVGKLTTESYPVDFSSTIEHPNITVDGSIEDAWNINADVSGLSFDNLLSPLDKSLINIKGVDDIKNSLVNVKLPNIDEIVPTVGPIETPTSMPTVGPIDIPTSIPTVGPIDIPTSIPTVGPIDIPTSIPTLGPIVIPTETSTPTVGPIEIPTETAMPTSTATPTVNPTETSTASPTESPTATPTTSVPDVPTTKFPYKKYINKVIVVAIISLIGVCILIFSKKQGLTEGIPLLKKKNDNKENIDEHEDIEKTYKHLIIDEGMCLLISLKNRYQKGSRELTPREVIYMFLNNMPEINYDICFEFLKEFEEVTFYTAEVDEAYYIHFKEICSAIYNFMEQESQRKEQPTA